jgi:PAS domain S-box-containing protein
MLSILGTQENARKLGSEGRMGDNRLILLDTAGSEPSSSPARKRFSVVWSILAALVLAAAVCAVGLRLLMGPMVDPLLMCVALAAAGVLALDFMIRRSASAQLSLASPAAEAHKALVDSAGPAMAAIDLDGNLVYMNPAAERMLGYSIEELRSCWASAEIFASGEAQRVLAELQRISGTHRWPHPGVNGGLNACLDCMRQLPPSAAPGIEVKLRRKDGSHFPVTLLVSALRSRDGAISGLAVVAVNESGRAQASPAGTRESFQNPAEIGATLDPTGHFLKANPAWRRFFGIDQRTPLDGKILSDMFAPASRGQVAALFQRALDSETIDRAPLRHHAADGRPLELELSLTRDEADASAVRCLLRDVTQQKRREQRLALQFALNQMVDESESPEAVTGRILGALCVSEGWEIAIQWEVDAQDDRLRFNTAWGAPGGAETLIKESMALVFAAGEELPGRALKEGRPVWIGDLASLPSSGRARSALRREMVAGWAAPVRVGKKITAVLEFYCRFPLREDHEAESAVEAVAASLGQIQERRQQRRRTEDLYRQQEILLDSVADGICGIDLRGVVSFVNPAAARLLGADPSLLSGKPMHDVLHGFAPAGGRCGEDCAIRRAAVQQVAAAGEENIFRIDGTSFPAEYALTPIVDQRRLSGFVLSFRDISQRFALDQLKDEFISTVSHELRTPLTSIRGALGLLSAGILDQTNKKAENLLRIALTNSDRLVRLINDILDLERIQSGREPLSFRPVQLGDLVRQAIEGMQPVAESAGVQLIHDATQVEVAADPDRLLQVLTNLLSNAIKFSPANSTVSVMLRPGVTGVTASVIDHGRGIPPDKLEAIFGRFQQVDASDSRQKGGTGLGLAICRTIVLQHSGRIWAERNPLRGSTFRIFLPYRPDTLERREATPESEAPIQMEPSSGMVRTQTAAPVSNL